MGVDEERFPRDFGVYGRYYNDLRRIPARYAMPGALSLEQREQFLREAGNRYAVEWVNDPRDGATQGDGQNATV